jgi:acyl-CoA synthetase (AMP-forming)/AMP-acid ligase II
LTDLVPNIAAPASIPSLESISVPSLQKIILVDNSQGRIDISKHLSKALRYGDVVAEGGSGDRGLQLDVKLDADEIVNIQFTSGTTSKPKAASLTHRNILNNGNSIGDRMHLTPKDIVCCPPPLFQYVFISFVLSGYIANNYKLLWLYSRIHGNSNPWFSHRLPIRIF